MSSASRSPLAGSRQGCYSTGLARGGTDQKGHRWLPHQLASAERHTGQRGLVRGLAFAVAGSL